MKHSLTILSRVVKTGAVNFVRNLWLAIAAMVVMIVTLTIILFALITNATFSHTITQITNKIDVSVYLKDSVTSQQKDQLIAELRQLPNVKNVTYLSKQQAAASFGQQNAGNPQLQQAINETGNPLPATIHITPRNLNQLQSIRVFLSKPQVSSLQAAPTDYSGARKKAIDNISHATDILREIGVAAVIIFTVVSAVIIFNTIQMAIFNRREELQIMRLLGAGTWYIRGPFVIESIIYGIVAGLISVGLIEAVFVTARSALQATSLGLLDIHYAEGFFDGNFILLLLLQLALGILIGAVSSILATRRYLKFKSSK